MALAAVYGASYQTDAYLVAVLIPTAILATIFGSLKTTIIPVYTRILNRDPEDARKLMKSIFLATGAVSLGIMFLGFFMTPFIVRLLAPGFTGETYNLTVRLARILMPAVPFVALAAAATGILHSHKSFLLPAAVGLPYNIILIFIMLYFGSLYGITAAAVAMVIAIASQFALQLHGLAKVGLFSPGETKLYHPGLKEIALLTGPILIGLLGNEINLIVDRILASTLAEGSITALNFAKRLYGMPNSLFGVAIMTVFYPELTRLAAIAEHNELKRCFQRAVTSILLMLTPMMIGYITLRTPIVQVLFERRAFDRAATEATAAALLFYSLGLVAVALRQLLARTFYSFHDTRTPVLISLSCIVLNIVFNLILIRPMGHAGLALATSLANLLVLIPMFNLLRCRLGSVNGRKIIFSLSKIGFASVIMGVVVWCIYMQLLPVWVGTSDLARAALLGSIISSGAFIYFALCYVFKVEEMRLILNFLRKKLTLIKAEI